jgi:hypothetical protein
LSLRRKIVADSLSTRPLRGRPLSSPRSSAMTRVTAMCRSSASMRRSMTGSKSFGVGTRQIEQVRFGGVEHYYLR